MTGSKRLIFSASAALFIAGTAAATAVTVPRFEITGDRARSVHQVAAIPRAKPRSGGGIAAVILGSVPIPREKPTASRTAAKTPAAEPAPSLPAVRKPAKAEPVRRLKGIGTRVDSDGLPAISGDLKDAMTALRKGKIKRAIGIRNGMRPSLTRRIIDWQLARSGARGISAAFIARFSAEAKNWPDTKLLRIRTEQALFREKANPAKTLKVFAGTSPISTGGAILLARAHLAQGRKDRAARLIRDIWRSKRLSKSMQAAILKGFGKLLRHSDHKVRADAMLYRERISDAQRVTRFLTKPERALVAARSAVIRRKKAAGKLLKAVPSSLRKDPSYLFARVQYLRRSKQWKAAGKILVTAPRDPRALINPDEWWVERRLVSRKLLELGNAKTAYLIAARHSAATPSKQAEAEFHAGWYALRFTRDPARAKPHFRRILTIGKSAITRSRGYYWLGRTAEAGNDTSAAKANYTKAAAYGSAFYGQLARAKLGKSSVGIGRVAGAGKADRSAFSSNELVKAIAALAAAGLINRTLPLFLQLSKTLPNAAQAALLIKLAERHGKHRYALIAGKQVARRWNSAASLAFPVNAIPAKTKIKRGVEKPMVYAIARQESAFDPRAVSHAGARGLLQMLPSTAKATARRNKIAYSKKRLTSDAAYNATLGAAHLGELVDNFNGSYIMTFAGYNAGPRRVTDWVKRFGDPRSPNVDAVDWIERIPFTETRNYVQRITENLQVYRARLNGAGLKIEKDLRRGGK